MNGASVSITDSLFIGNKLTYIPRNTEGALDKINEDIFLIKYIVHCIPKTKVKAMKSFPLPS